MVIKMTNRLLALVMALAFSSGIIAHAAQDPATGYPRANELVGLESVAARDDSTVRPPFAVMSSGCCALPSSFAAAATPAAAVLRKSRLVVIVESPYQPTLSI